MAADSGMRTPHRQKCRETDCPPMFRKWEGWELEEECWCWNVNKNREGRTLPGRILAGQPFVVLRPLMKVELSLVQLTCRGGIAGVY